MIGRKIFSLRNKVKRKKTTQKSTVNTTSLALKGVAVIIFILLVALISPVLVSLYKFQPNVLPGGNEVEKWDYSKKFKILLIGVDIKSEKHIFVDGLVLLIVDPGNNQVGMININPDIVVSKSSGEEVSLRRGIIDGDKMDVIGLTEELIATQIDRYIFLDRVYFEKMSEYTNTIRIENPSDVNDSDVTSINSSSMWGKGLHTIGSGQVIDYLKSDNNGEDEQLQRQLNLYSRYTQSIDPLKLVLGTSKIIKIISENIQTNLTRNEIYYLYYYLRSVPPASYSSAFTKSDILSEVGTAGVYNVYRINEAQLDYTINSILEDKQTVLEQTTVEVLNASGQSGEARRFARWIGNAGMEVIHVGNAPFGSENSLIYTPNSQEYPLSTKKLRDIFGEQVKFIDEEYEYRHIGKVVVIIGAEK